MSSSSTRSDRARFTISSKEDDTNSSPIPPWVLFGKGGCKICGKTFALRHHYCSSCLSLLRAKERQLKEGASEHPELFFKEELTILSLDKT